MRSCGRERIGSKIKGGTKRDIGNWEFPVRGRTGGGSWCAKIQGSSAEGGGNMLALPEGRERTGVIKGSKRETKKKKGG